MRWAEFELAHELRAASGAASGVSGAAERSGGSAASGVRAAAPRSRAVSGAAAQSGRGGMHVRDSTGPSAADPSGFVPIAKAGGADCAGPAAADPVPWDWQVQGQV